MDQKQLAWDEYFLKIAETVALKSKDPSTKCGCIVVDQNRRIISTGYNGLIQGADESKLTMTERPMKYHMVVHAEMNAALFARRDLTGCTVYCNFATCENCLKHCLQAGIKRFVYQKLRVHSHSSDGTKSMTNYETDEAIVRMLAAMPDVKTLNVSNGKTYIEDILEQYDEGSEEYNKLKAWL